MLTCLVRLFDPSGAALEKRRFSKPYLPPFAAGFQKKDACSRHRVLDASQEAGPVPRPLVVSGAP